MIKIEFHDKGGFTFQFPKAKNRKQEECYKRFEEVINAMDPINPGLLATLGIAATNGPKTFDKALSYFNVA